ncbi:MAG: ROK family protein [Planctomycetota bacterium]
MDASSSSRLILGWDVGGTTSGAAVGTPDGDLAATELWPSGAERGPDAMIEDFAARAGPLIERHAPRALGVSIGGPLNPLTGVVRSPPHLPDWDEVPLADRLGRRLGLPVVVEHDAAACLEAEVLWGAGRGASHAVYLTCGTGFGAGILVDGRVLRGPHGETPELGHIRLAPGGPVCFDKAGSAESFCSGTGIARLAPFLFPERFDGPVEPARLFALAEAGDPAARAVLDESARRTGQACALLADLFAPQVIVLGSLARYFGEGWQETVRAAFREEALAANSRETTILPAGLGDRLQPLSAIAPAVFRS